MNPMRALIAILPLFCPPALWAQAAQISGSVRNYTGNAPLAGASVEIRRALPPFTTELVASGTTAADGSFDLAVNGGCNLPCTVRVTAAGRIVAPALRTVSVAPGANATQQDFTAAIPASIRVRVQDHATQQVIASAPLRLIAGGGTEVAVAQPDGTQLFGSVFPGAASVCVIDNYDNFVNECQNDQKLSLSNSVDALIPLQLGEAALTEVVIGLDAGARLTGVLRNSHSDLPIANTMMRISMLLFAGTPAYDVDTRTDATGNYSVRGIPPGAFRLEASSMPGDLYYSRTRYPGIECFNGQCSGAAGSYFTVLDTAVVADAGFDLFPGSVVRGRVLDAATSLGIAGVDVAAYAPGVFTGPIEIQRATTGADGRYELAHVPPQSTLRLGTANTLGYANRSYPDTPCTAPCANGQDVEFEPGISTSALNFTLGAARAIAGRIDLGAANGSTLGTSVVLYRLNGGVVQSLWSQSLVGDASFVSPGLDAGTYYAAAFVTAGLTQCQVFQGQPCPATGGPIVVGQATPIVLPATPGIYPGIQFSFTIDAIFANGLEPAP